MNIQDLLPKNYDKYPYDDEGRNGCPITYEILDILLRDSPKDRQTLIELRKILGKSGEFDGSQIENLEIYEQFEKKIRSLIIDDEDANGLVTIYRILLMMYNVGGRKEVHNEYGEIDMYIPHEKDRELFISISEEFSNYANSFFKRFEDKCLRFMCKYKKIPVYMDLFKTVFCDYVKDYMDQSLNKIKFNEEEFKEYFGIIQESLSEIGFYLEPSDNIKQDFIRLCRDKYPNASKKNNFLFANKSFRDEFIKHIKKGFYGEGKSGSYGQLGEDFDQIVKYCRDKYIEKDNINCNNSELEDTSSKHSDSSLFVSNITINAVSYINGLRNNDSVFGKFFQYIVKTFENDHLNKQEKVFTNEKEPLSAFDNSGIITKKPGMNGWKNSLSENENNLIKEAVSFIDCDDKKKKIIVKYLTKLKIKDLPLRFYGFKRLFNLKEIPPKTESILIDQLGMDYEVEEEELKAEEEISRGTTGKTEKEIKSNNTIHEKAIIENPTEYLIDKLKSVGCIIDNEATAKKQIDEFCLNDNYKTILINLVRSPRFGKVFLHRNGRKTARVINVGTTGWRILFEKREDGNLHFICFTDHDNYEERLAKLK